MSFERIQRGARFVCACVLLLAGCSGGSKQSGPSLSLSTTSVLFTGLFNGPTPPPQSVGASISGGTGFVGISGITGVFNATFSITGRATGVVTITANPPTMTPGTYTGTVAVRACADSGCSGGDISGSPAVINITYTIQQAGIVPSPPSINFNRLDGGAAPAPQTLNLSELANVSHAWTASVEAPPVSWLAVNGGTTASGTSLPASVSVSIIAPEPQGTYSAFIQISGSGNGLLLPVTYTVSPPVAPSPASLSYTVGDTPQPSDLVRQIAPTAFPGVTWTATSNVPWLAFSPASGGSADSLSVSLVRSGIDALNNGKYNATVTLTPSFGSAAKVSVSLTVARTQINYVAPYVALAGTQEEVIIRGDNLDQVTVASVSFGATAAAAFSVISATEIHATHPALSAGTYPIQVGANSGTIRTLGTTLVVVNAPSYASAAIAYPNTTAKQPLAVVYDAERQALVVGVVYGLPGQSGEMFSFPFSGSAWGPPASVLIDHFRDFTLSIDGKQLLAATDFSLQHIDAAALSLGANIPFGISPLFATGVAVANDGNALLSVRDAEFPNGVMPVYLYSVRDAQFLGLVNGPASEGLAVPTQPGASADGSLILIGAGSPLGEFLGGQYNAAAGSFPSANLFSPNGFRPMLDRRATRILLDGSAILNSNFAGLGGLSTLSTGVTLSPDGTRAYQYVSGTAAHAYDLTTAGFPEIGTGITLPSAPGANPVMTISPDGGTLFIAGSDGIVVVPVP